MSDLNDDPQETADRLGLEMVLPGPRELFVDLDSIGDLTHYEAMLALCAEIAGKDISPAKRTVSPGGNTHAYLVSGFLATFGDGSKEQAILRIALQACLGSDRKRELLSLLRILFCLDCPPTVFFETRGLQPAALNAPEIVDSEIAF